MNRLLSDLKKHLKIMPLLVLVASLALTVRTGELALGVHHSGVAFAEEKQEPVVNDAEQQSVDEMKVAEAKTNDSPEDEESEDHAASDSDEDLVWKNATESEFEFSDVKQGLYDDLAKRRAEIDEKEKALTRKAALLEAASRELDQKLREMNAVKAEIEALMAEQSEEEMARVNSLVRIYEGMKAKDAARIFNTLDMDVLIDVISRMSERKSAPILAEMNAERARSVTILLAQQKQIPSIPPQ